MQVLEKRMYTANATAIGGRDGHAKSDDGVLDVRITPPKALGGKDVGTNPEQLFAAGYAACFGSALSHVAKAQKVAIGEIKITARVTLGQVGQGFGLAVELEADLPDLPRDQALKLVETAHQVCPYSNATRGNIEVDLKVK